MKTNSKYIAHFISLVAAGLLVASASQAATQPASITNFTASVTDDIFSVKSKGWRDPAFGNKGWTHSSDWGTVRAKQGQTVTITMQTNAIGIHPGITVWHRGVNDTAPDGWVVDHFYPQDANFVKLGAVDGGGLPLGDIVMRHVVHAYDKDGNAENVSGMNPERDGIPGQLEMSFTAPRNGLYMFVVGGFNPDAGVDTTLKYDINVNVTVSAPAP